jgi:hypothetical protein
MAEGRSQCEATEREEKPVSVSVSRSTRCKTDADTGELKCHTLERVWKQYADGSTVSEETRRPASAAGWNAGPLALVDGLSHIVGGILGAQLGAARTPQLGERRREAEQPPDRPPGGGQWA